MEIIQHRRNTIKELQSTPTHFGVEVDIRTFGSELILHHDSKIKGERLIDWLSEYSHGTLILNTKEEGLEQELIQLMTDYAIKRYFFLDLSFPYLIKTSNQGCTAIAARFSEYESLQSIELIHDRIEWVWVDCFSQIPMEPAPYRRLEELGLKVCMVSPELVGRYGCEVDTFRRWAQREQIQIHAVCTKRPDQWLGELGNG